MRLTRTLLLSWLFVATVHAQLSLTVPEDDDSTTPSARPSSAPPSSPPSSRPNSTPAPGSTSAPAEDTKPSSTNPASASRTPESTPPPEGTTVVSTNAGGETVFFTTTRPRPSASATDSAEGSENTSDNDKNKDDDGLSIGSIVGIAVAGGVAALGVIGFLIWKFTRKRFTDFEDTEAIKWPELNAHGGAVGAESGPLPTHTTGRSGFGTTSELSLSRHDSHTGQDPYAVPTAPHLNPSVPIPYRDDPNVGNAAFYDPYSGPVPQTFNEANNVPGSGWPQTGGEAYPMAQMGRASPGLGQSYGQYDAGRASPAPVPMAGRASPGPYAVMGRASPAPPPMYGRTSPGPGPAYEPYR